MEEKELKQECLKLMETSEVAYLGTIGGDGFPQIRAMMNLRNKEQWPGLSVLFGRHKEDFLIYFTTCGSTAKVEQIRANPSVSVYYARPEQFHGMMVAGKIEVVTDENLKKEIWQDGWEMYYPDKKYTLLRLLPAFAKGWYKEGPFEFGLCRAK